MSTSSASAATSVSSLRVRYSETDQMGVVYHANYLVWFEVARTDLLRQFGWTYREMEASGVRLPVIEAHCIYQRPARYDDEIEVRARARLLSAVRMEFTYEVVLTKERTTAAVGTTRHAALTMEGRPCRLPDRILEAFA
ncbi:MAG: thioesterase family protein [Vicinamibacterales bacterium]